MNIRRGLLRVPPGLDSGTLWWALAFGVLLLVLMCTSCSALGLYTGEALRAAMLDAGFATDEQIDEVVARTGSITDEWWPQLLGVGIAAIVGGQSYTRWRRGPSHKRVIPQIVAAVMRQPKPPAGESAA